MQFAFAKGKAPSIVLRYDRSLTPNRRTTPLLAPPASPLLRTSHDVPCPLSLRCAALSRPRSLTAASQTPCSSVLPTSHPLTQNGTGSMDGHVHASSDTSTNAGHSSYTQLRHAHLTHRRRCTRRDVSSPRCRKTQHSAGSIPQLIPQHARGPQGILTECLMAPHAAVWVSAAPRPRPLRRHRHRRRRHRHRHRHRHFTSLLLLAFRAYSYLYI